MRVFNLLNLKTRNFMEEDIPDRRSPKTEGKMVQRMLVFDLYDGLCKKSDNQKPASLSELIL